MPSRLLTVLTPMLAVSLLGGTMIAQAGTASGKVISAVATRASLFAFYVGPIAGRASCTPIDEWAIDNSQPGGRAMIATILAAWAQGLTVDVQGTGNCDAWGDRESAAFVSVHP